MNTAREMAACEWVLRLQGPSADEETMTRWLEWCQADRENLAAFRNAHALWNRFDDKRLATSLALDLTQPAAAIQSPPAPARRRHRRWPIAASLVLAAGAAAWFAAQTPRSAPYTQTLRTATGALERQTLPDGSTVELGARSTLSVNLDSRRRDIVMENGEAFFQVAADPNRPFVVRAGGVEITAIGTAFNVRKTEERIVVTVTEGAVRVAPASSDGQVRASAGHRVVYSPQQQTLTMTSETSAPARPSWQSGRLEFVNEPLRLVIADLNRYSSRPIAFEDDAIGTWIFTGTLRSDAIDDWLHGLTDVFPMEVVDKGMEGIALRRRAVEK